MLWSDSTHLASFGNASLWPIYLYIGNLSKYIHLGWLSNQPYDGDESPFTDDECRQLIFVNNQIYGHKVIHINYMTYDLHRAQDLLNLRTHPDFMMFSHDDNGDDPFSYWFGWIIRDFHTKVNYMGPNLELIQGEKFDFLFAWWYGQDMIGGWCSKHLHRISFVPGNDSSAFGFLDPQEVIQAVHLIPTFHYRKTSNSLPCSPTAQWEEEKDKDWEYYYVSMWVNLTFKTSLYSHWGRFMDQDMRYDAFLWGEGVRHKSMCEATKDFLSDRDAVDRGMGQETEIMVEGLLGESGIVVEGNGDNLVLENAVDEDNEYDYGYVDDLGDADWQDNDDNHCTVDGAVPDLGELGPEDGEDAYALDDEDFGFADL